MRKVDLHGLTGLVLAVGVIAIGVILALETVLHNGTITPEESGVLSTIVGAILVVLADHLKPPGGTPSE